MHEEIPAQLFLSCLNLIVNLNYASIDLRVHSLTNQLYEEVGGLVSFHEDSDTISSFMCYLKVLLYVDNSIIFPLIDRISEFFHSYLSINNEINIYSLQGYCKCLEIQPYTIHHLIRTQQIYFILENLLNPNPEVTIEVMKFITIILTKCDNEIKCSIPINFEQWSILSQSESHEIKELFCLYTKLIINSNWMLIIPMYTANVFHCLLNIITCDTYFKLKKLAIEPLLIALEQFDTEQIEEIISVEFIDTCFDLINSCDEQMNLQIVKCFKYLLCVGMNGKIISKIYSAELVEKLNDALDLLKNSDVEEVRYEAMNLSQKIFKVCDEIDEESY
ncbi:hypothetical protein GPJ56_010800 [Histomonas meleagridis]|uniref:uncharacterized protein n=1 Tax=Histomonas meleagridis TaxID=135588 RepID=UPI0035598D8C|nr:hypothetical protein GPJ56_010800 [Histomonas meleagridis]KAH0801137.1 hypothetical protein GO595_006172 [Histomonas meleagridis]